MSQVPSDADRDDAAPAADQSPDNAEPTQDQPPQQNENDSSKESAQNDDAAEPKQESAKEKPLEGKVVSVGNGKILDDGSVRELAVKSGDKILFGKYAGTEIKVDGEELIILREDDVLAVVE